MTYQHQVAKKPNPRANWLTETQTAERLNMSVKWLQKDRLHGSRLRYAKFGSAVRYALADIEAFERASMRSSTSNVGADPRRVSTDRAE